jgi:hypothetical protein
MIIFVGLFRMTAKRSHIEIDPDYEDVSEVQNKRRRVIEEGGIFLRLFYKLY